MKIFFDDGTTHELTADEARLLRFAVRHLYPFAETAFKPEEIERLDAAADNLRAVFGCGSDREEFEEGTDQQLGKYDMDVMNGRGYYDKDGGYVAFANPD